jgi:hypothetical protein
MENNVNTTENSSNEEQSKPLKQGAVMRGAFNCPCCGGEMPKAEHYGGLPSNIYQIDKCKKCGLELVSQFDWVKNKDGGMGEFFWAKW